jgi:hypothetical protein
VSRTQLITLQEKHIFSPTLINTATVGFNRARLDLATVPLTAEAADPSLEFVPGTGFGRLTVAQSVNVGALPLLGVFAPARSAYNTYQYADDLRWIKGNHNIQLGGLVSRMQNNTALLGFGGAGGTYQFNSLQEYIRGEANTFSGHPIGSTDPVSGEFFVNDRNRGWRQVNMGFYIQDDFKVRPNLTLNLGLRHESMTTIGEVNGRMSNRRSPAAEFWTIGDPTFNNPGKLAFQPRIGIAWDPFGDGKTAIRAGTGIFHDIITGVNYVEAGGWGFPWSGSVRLNFPPASSFPNPLDGTENPRPIAIHMNPDLKFPGKVQFNLNIQREVMPGTMLSVAYVGSKSSHLFRRFDANVANPIICPCADDPGYPDFDESTLPAGTKFFPSGSVRRNDALDLDHITATDGNGFYHSFQLSLNRRFSSGLQFQASYTHSKAIDDGSQQLGSEGRNAPQNATQYDNRKADRSFSNWDVRNNFSFNFTYELPFGSGLSGAARQLVGGWTINSILTFTSGPPSTANNGADFAKDATFNRSTHVRQVPGRSNNPVIGKDHTQWFDPTAFQPPELGTYGDVSRNTLRSPGFNSIDFSVNKYFPIGEQVGMEFRAEFFNLFNHPNWGRPFANLFNSSGAPLGAAGRITSTVGTSRQIQFALKLIF